MSSSPPTSIQYFMWTLWQPLLKTLDPLCLEERMQTAICYIDPQRADPNFPMPQNVITAQPKNKEKSYKKFLETQCSAQWQTHLKMELNNPPGRLRAYVHWHFDSKQKRNMYKPAPYLTHQSPSYQLELLRIRTQSMIHLIPSHLHLLSSDHISTTKIERAPTAYSRGQKRWATKSTSSAYAQPQK